MEGCMNGHFPFSATRMHISSHYLFSHPLLSADFAVPFLIFMPLDTFTPASQGETSVSHLSALFKWVLIRLCLFLVRENKRKLFSTGSPQVRGYSPLTHIARPQCSHSHLWVIHESVHLTYMSCRRNDDFNCFVCKNVREPWNVIISSSPRVPVDCLFCCIQCALISNRTKNSKSSHWSSRNQHVLVDWAGQLQVW